MAFNFPKGVYTVLVTPFVQSELKELTDDQLDELTDEEFAEYYNSKHRIDFANISKWVDFQCSSQVAGLVLLGTTSESPTLDRDEQFEIVKYVSAENKKHSTPKFLVVGVGGNNTYENLCFARKCVPYCDAFMVTVPSYSKPTQHGIFEHFRVICSNKRIATKPVIIYNIPSRAGINMDPQTIKNVCDTCPNVIAIKEASGSIDQLIKLREIVPGLQVFSGDDKLVLDVMTHGGCGVISVASNVIPNIISQIVELCFANESIMAMDKYYGYGLPKFIELLFCETNPIPVKYMMHAMGLYNNHEMRLPMTELSTSKEMIVSDVFEKILCQEKILSDVLKEMFMCRKARDCI